MKYFIYLLLFCCAHLNAVNLAQAGNFESNNMTINGTDYHYISKGDPKNPLILFLHGFPESSIAWSDQLETFSQNYHAVAIDLKGYGLSGKPSEISAYTVESVMEDVSLFAKNLSNKPFVLVGHDWGGAIAWYFGIKHPEQLSKLIVINGAHPIQFFREYFTNQAQYDASEYIRQIQTGEHDTSFYSKDNFKELRVTLFDNSIGQAQTFFDNEMQKNYLNSWSIDHAFDSSLNYYKAMKFPPSILFTAGLPVHLNPLFNSFHVEKVPTLVLWGEKDIYLNKSVNDGLEKMVSDLKIIYFPNNSHWIVHEIPDQISSKISEFISLNK